MRHASRETDKAGFKEEQNKNIVTLGYYYTQPPVNFPGAFYFLSAFSFTNIHNSQYSKGRSREFLELRSTTSTRFTDTSTAGRLLRGAHLCS